MFTVDDDTIRNIDSSDSEDGEAPRRKSQTHTSFPVQEKERKMSCNQDHPEKWNRKKKRYQLIPSPQSARLKRTLWMLIVGVSFLILCSASALLLKRNLLSKREATQSQQDVWWKFPTTSMLPDALQLPGGHYIFSRKSWSGLQDPETEPTPLHTIPVVAIASTGGATCYDFTNCTNVMQEWDMEHMNGSSINYSFLVGGDGNVYEEKGWGAQQQVLVVGFIGDYGEGKQELTQEQTEAAQELIKHGVELGTLSSEYALVALSQVERDNVVKVISGWSHWNPQHEARS